MYLLLIFLLFEASEEVTAHKCDLRKFAEDMKNHTPLFENQCFMCSKASCDFLNTSMCNLTSTLGPIPLYNDLLQGGMIHMGVYLLVADIIYAKNCRLEVRFYLGDEMFVRFYECKDDAVPNSDLRSRIFHEGCSLRGESIHFGKSDFFFFTIKFARKKFQVHASFQEKGEFFKIDGKNLTKVSLSCSPIKNPPVVRYRFYHLEECTNETGCTLNDSSGLMVPCSPGGFLIDPNTGKFAQGEYLKKLTNLDDNSGLANDLGINPDDTFPVKEDDKSDKPAYIDDNGEAKPAEIMNPRIYKLMMRELFDEDTYSDGLSRNYRPRERGNPVKRIREKKEQKGNMKRTDMKNIFNFLFFDKGPPNII